jgi:hypothetical protein
MKTISNLVFGARTMLKQVLNKEKLNQSQKNELIEYCYKIAYRYAKYSSAKLLHIPHTQSTFIQDLAVDAIALLFSQNENGDFPNLYKTIEKWKPDIKTTDDLFFCLNRVIAKLVQQQVTVILKENDPFFARLLDKINYKIKQENLKKHRYLGVVYIVRENMQLDLNTPVISPEDFNLLTLDKLISEEVVISDILTELSSKNFFPAVPLNNLIKRLKLIIFLSYENNKTTGVYYDNLNSNEIVNYALDFVKNKLQEAYILKKKITPEEGNVILSALSAISEDLKNGGISLGIHNYILSQHEDITKVEYKIRYRPILEYLFKVMKNKIVNDLKKDF